MKRWLLAITLGSIAAIVGLVDAPRASAEKKKQSPVVRPRTGKSETIHLFNDRDLEGWEGYDDLWSVKDGVIVAKNTSPLKFSTYLLTKKKFTDFRLVFAAKLVESEMHSGVAFWGSAAERRKDRKGAMRIPTPAIW